MRHRLPRLIANHVRASVETLQVVVQMANELEMHDVLLASPQRVRCSNHVKLPVGVVSLLHNLDYLGLVAPSRELLDTCKALIDLHVDGVQRNIICILCHVYQNFDLKQIVNINQKTYKKKLVICLIFFCRET